MSNVTGGGVNEQCPQCLPTGCHHGEELNCRHAAGWSPAAAASDRARLVLVPDHLWDEVGSALSVCGIELAMSSARGSDFRAERSA